MENLIEVTLQNLLQKISIDYSKIEIEKIDEARYKININSTDSSLLIGYNGASLNALEHLLNILIKKISRKDDIYIKVDVDSYRHRQEERIKNLALRKAEICKNTDQPQILAPMSSYYRRIIHLYISENFPNLITESIGEGERRQIVIKLKDS
ncbi:MAG: Single-stranded nucleic acid binding R3H domain protein [Candidatus Peregrinibacteria bacterium GW2011_GWA2_33_10]|nr:MAG: Single-stranded nucleic acid binding R3H domain protein [Candidatus Peregrinibacteria bacterium GW2011_GWA2_33_10]KKP40808.1 MAG: single-stranded nucleic acid binding R3H domain-containing protein, spoIIIJ-associated protein [Candidatus Peregrinibacteria bacterium GW2011_GWC2_33_13]OGJ48032.1 MAG: hypothetical protein A2229_03285 [Candidatus Peregrinibacteria bacterium RIFOXYA2_FULL_33_7]